MRIDHFAIGANDVEFAAGWYRDVIGLRELADQGGRRYLGCGGRADFDLVIEPGGPGLRHVAYACFDATEFDALRVRMRASGLASGDVVFHGPNVSDAESIGLPGGHVVQVVLRSGEDRYPSISEWAAAAAHSPRGIDHVNIAARDVDASVRALNDALDLRLSDIHHVDGPGTVGAWLRAGDRHHDFAVIYNPEDGLHHIAYQVADASALVAFADRLTAAGTRAEYGIGRHSPGANLFLYVRDPSGNRVELTADMAIVPHGAPHRVWRGKDTSIVNSLAPYVPPRTFWEIT